MNSGCRPVGRLGVVHLGDRVEGVLHVGGVGHLSLLVFWLCPVLSAQAQDQYKVDYAALVDAASLSYDRPVTRSEEGMPIGNGRMGGLVWTTSSSIRFQINRVDVFGNNSASNNFYERHSDYCGGVGFVDVDFLKEDVFAGAAFKQHLSCYDGAMTIDGSGIKSKVTAWNEQDVMAVQVTDNHSATLPVHIKLRALRPLMVSTGNHRAISELRTVGNTIALVQEFREDSYYCSSSLVIEVTGAEVEAAIENETTLRLVAKAGQHDFTVWMATSATFDAQMDVLNASLQKLDMATKQGFDNVIQSNKTWWHDFWQKSFIRLQANDSKASMIQAGYYYYLYLMACSSRGTYPVKFNGMIWTTGGDARKWGSQYWGANQSCLYNALFESNHLELLDPMFNMYSSMRASCEAAAVQQWGSRGIYIPETVPFDGLSPLPEDIADEMRALYLGNKDWRSRSDRFSDYSFTKMPFDSRWNWKKDEGWKKGRWTISDKGAGAFGHTTHIFSRGAKIAYQYWLRYEYTQNMAWLEHEAYPMLRGVAEFYRNFPNLKKERDGTYHIYLVNDNESIWAGHNTIEELSSMMGILPAAIRASEILDVDSDLRNAWQELLDHLSPLPSSKDYNADEPPGSSTWVKALPPIRQGNGGSLPDPNTMPTWFFDLCTLESDSSVEKTASNTFDAYFPRGINDSTSMRVLSKLAVAGSLLGRAESTRYLISNQIETDEVEPLRNRMDLREGYQTTSAQRLGRAAEALQYALCQSVPPKPGTEPVIHVFPAWPPAWDAQFALLCRGGYMVSSSVRNKKIEFIEIISQIGGVCRVRNPWTGIRVTMYRNGKKWRRSGESMLTFNTNRGDHFVLIPEGTTLDQFFEIQVR